MAITWTEDPGSAEVQTGSAIFHYTLCGTADRQVAYALAKAYSASQWVDLYRSKIIANEVGPKIFKCSVEYGTAQNKEPSSGDFKWAFDTTGGTRTVKHGLSHIYTYYSPSGIQYDHKGAIGVTNDGVEGVEVGDQSFKWTETWQLLTGSYAGFSYSSILGAYSGRVMNNASFRGMAAGTVKFSGASGGQSTKDPDIMEVMYHFEFSPNESGISIGDIYGIEKYGWDYLWVRYDERKDEARNTTVLTPVQVEIDRVFCLVSFSVFGIGS